MASTKGGSMPKWSKSSAELSRTFELAVKPLPGAELRKMFGYPCAFVNGQMFAGLHQENLFLRLPAPDREEFLALPGATPFEPMPGRPMREYVVVPPEMVAATSALSPWLEKALVYAASLPEKPAPRKASPKHSSQKA